jgi:hypothetical protein
MSIKFSDLPEIQKRIKLLSFLETEDSEYSEYFYETFCKETKLNDEFKDLSEEKKSELVLNLLHSECDTNGHYKYVDEIDIARNLIGITVKNSMDIIAILNKLFDQKIIVKYKQHNIKWKIEQGKYIKN